MGFPRHPVEFESEGATLRGCLFPAAVGAPPFPLVVMAMGTSATMRMVGDRYAERFAEAGVSALLYDHRNLGSSDGEPRQEINPWVQCRGYRDAITFASGLELHDPERIGLWGSSYSGGEAVLVAALDPRVVAVVAQCPVFGVEPPDLAPSLELFERIRDNLDAGDVSGGPEDRTGPLPVVSADPASNPPLLHPIQAFRWFIDYGGRPGSGWQNRVSRVIPSSTAPYSPYLCAPHVKAPTLMVVAHDDEMPHANPDTTRGAFDLVPGEKVWHEVDGGHFGLLYHPSELFDEVSTIEAEFLVKHLGSRPESGGARPG